MSNLIIFYYFFSLSLRLIGRLVTLGVIKCVRLQILLKGLVLVDLILNSLFTYHMAGVSTGT